jgi:hypothetical protein
MRNYSSFPAGKVDVPQKQSVSPGDLQILDNQCGNFPLLIHGYHYFSAHRLRVQDYSKNEP